VIRESIASSSKQNNPYISIGLVVQRFRFLLKPGWILFGHDESEESFNKGNFIELLSVPT
jgi:hypothetical protein